MTDKNASLDIERMAADWVVRLERDDVDEADRKAHADWLEEDRRHRGAYVRAMAIWRSLDRARALGTDFAQSAAADDSAPEPTAYDDRSLTRRRLVASGGAALAASLIAAIMLRPTRSQAVTTYATRLGEIKRLPLADGSVVMLNTASRIDVALGADLRAVRIVEGECWLNVAKNPVRPFVVSTDCGEIRAIGTAFVVRQSAGRTDVTVTDGAVELSVSNKTIAPVRVLAGWAGTVDEQGRVGTRKLDGDAMKRLLAWREGFLGLNGESLGQAALELNRYNEKQIAVAPELSGETIVGWFDVNDPEGFARAAAASFDGRLVERDGRLEIVSAKK